MQWMTRRRGEGCSGRRGGEGKDAVGEEKEGGGQFAFQSRKQAGARICGRGEETLSVK